MNSPMKFKPFFVEVTRGSKVESSHLVHAVIFTRSTGTAEIYGDCDLPVFPRSSLKPIQALPLILTGTAKALNLSATELALACASHRGENIHLKPIKAWLEKIGLNETHLECGTHAPTNQESLFELLHSGQYPSPIHNNCSGKHTGMLSTAVHLGEPTKSYVAFAHPVQQRIQKVIEHLCDIELPPTTFGIDGCSIPAPCLPLHKLAEGFCEFGAPSRLTEEEANACHQIYDSVVTNPLLTSGTGQYCAEVMIHTKGLVLAKGGAEGVMILVIPSLQTAIALKTLDGNSRATEFCSSYLLRHLGFIDPSSPLLHPKIQNWNKLEVGELRLKSLP